MAVRPPIARPIMEGYDKPLDPFIEAYKKLLSGGYTGGYGKPLSGWNDRYDLPMAPHQETYTPGTEYKQTQLNDFDPARRIPSGVHGIDIRLVGNQEPLYYGHLGNPLRQGFNQAYPENLIPTGASGGRVNYNIYDYRNDVIGSLLARLKLDPQRRDYLRIEQGFLQPPYRGQGIYGNIIQSLYRGTKSEGIPLSSSPTNPILQRMYDRMATQDPKNFAFRFSLNGQRLPPYFFYDHPAALERVIQTLKSHNLDQTRQILGYDRG